MEEFRIAESKCHKMTDEQYGDIHLYWNENAIKKVRLTHDEWNAEIDKLKDYAELTTRVRGYKTCARYWHNHMVCYDESGATRTAYVYNNNMKDLLVISTSLDKDKNNDEKLSGTDAYKLVDKMFKQKCGTSLATAFGTWKRGNLEETIKEEGQDVNLYHYDLQQCNEALPAIIDFDEMYKGLIVKGYKADFSSAYPYQLTLPLPTTKGMLKEFGAVEPKEGYIAYWVNSGHIIGGGVDTRKLAQHPLYKKYAKFKQVENEITYLLPISEYSLAAVMQEMYDKRKINEQMKDAMVSFIGMLRSRKHFQKAYMGHISALVYARHITAMCNAYDTIVAEGGKPIMYATDSIIWLGKPSTAAVQEKKLGVFHSEYEGARMCIKACGVYAIEDGGKLAVVKHQGQHASTIKYNTLEDFQANNRILEEYYDKKTHKFVQKYKFI